MEREELLVRKQREEKLRERQGREDEFQLQSQMEDLDIMPRKRLLQLQVELDCAEVEHDAFEESSVHGTANNCEQEGKCAKSLEEIKSVVNAEGAILAESSAANVHHLTEPGPSRTQFSSKFQLSRAANVEAVTSMPTFSHLRFDEPFQAKPNHRATFNVSTFPSRSR